MTSSYTQSQTTTFTLTHAKHMAAKIASDLKRLQRFYGYPCDTNIANYEKEAIEFLKAGYLGTLTFGFKRQGLWIEPTFKYTAHELTNGSANDDDPGRIKPGANITRATFGSYLTYSSKWNSLSSSEKDTFEAGLPFRRTSAPESGIDGFLADDRIYSSGGRALNRASVRSY